MEWNILLQYFLSTSFIAAVLAYVGKIVFTKIVEKTIDSRLQKEVERFKNDISRKKMAYEIIINREFDYYEEVSKNFSHMMTYMSSISTIMELERTDSDKVEVYQYVKKYQECVFNVMNLSIARSPFLPKELALELLRKSSELVKIPIIDSDTGEIMIEGKDERISEIIGQINKMINDHLHEISK